MPTSGPSSAPYRFPARRFVFDYGPEHVATGITLVERSSLSKFTPPSDPADLSSTAGAFLELRGPDTPQGATGPLVYRRYLFDELVLVDTRYGVPSAVSGIPVGRFDVVVPEASAATWVVLVLDPGAVPEDLAALMGLDPEGGIQQVDRWPYEPGGVA